MSAATGHSAASSRGSTTAVARVAASCLRYFAPVQNVSVPGVAVGERRHAFDDLAGIAGELESVPDRDLAERHRHRAPPRPSGLRAWAVSRLPAPWT